MPRKKIGLALSGGGAKGLAQIGVLKVLEENNIPIDFIAGTSIGAVIGALYSAEPNAKKLEKEILNEKWDELFDYTIPTTGLIKGNKIEKFFEERLKNISFKDLKIPLFVTACDIERKQEIIFSKGSVAKALRASISIPGIFTPAENMNKILVDGGVIDPIPTEILEGKVDIIIAVNTTFMKIRKPDLNDIAVLKRGNKKPPHIMETISKSFQIITSEAAQSDLMGEKANFIINIDLQDIKTMEFGRAKEIIRKGERMTRRLLKDLKELTSPNPFKEFLEELNKELSLNQRK